MAFLLAESTREMTQGKEARHLGDLTDLQMRHLLHEPFGILHTQVGNPVTEGLVIHPVDVFGQISTVGTEFSRQFVQGDARLAVSFLTDPILNTFLHVCMIHGDVLCNVFSLVHTVLSLRKDDILQESIFHLLVKQDIVLITTIQIDIEGDGGEDPQEHIFVGQESKECTAHTKDDGPISEYGQPLDIRTDVIGMCVFKHPYRLVVSVYQAVGEEESVTYQLCRQEDKAEELQRTILKANGYHTG